MPPPVRSLHLQHPVSGSTTCEGQAAARDMILELEIKAGMDQSWTIKAGMDQSWTILYKGINKGG